MAKKEKSSSNDLSGKRVAFLGAGKMGGILLHALLKHGMLSPNLTCATVAHEERAKTLASKWNVTVGTSNADAAKAADIIVIAVKPQVVQDEGDQPLHHAEAVNYFGGGFGSDFADRKESRGQGSCGPCDA
jgi:glutamyl-tRNA reductase